jgi:signal transduction histidine kinase/CheY-like chemotaxis protein
MSAPSADPRDKDVATRPMNDEARRPAGAAEAGPEDEEERFRLLIESAADGVLVVRRDGTLGFANPAACALLGRTAADVDGRAFGIPVVPGETTEIDVVRPDGEARVAEMRAAATTWRGEPSYLASLRDVTERKRAEEAAREAAATLRSFYEGASMMMGVVELDGDDILHVSSNAATDRFLGARPARDRARLDNHPGVTRDVVDLWLARYREAERAGSHVRFEYLHPGPVGPIWLSATVGFIGRGPGGRPQFSFVAEDVTERKRAEEAAREAARRKDEFLAMLAHELRNPLAAIANAVDLARRSQSEEHRGWSEGVIRHQCGHLSRLVDDLLDVSRITRGTVQLRREPLEASPIVAAAVAVVGPLVDARRHRLVVSPSPDPLQVVADPTRLEQVLVNLLTNAAKYTDPGGRIDLSSTLEGSEIVFRIKDNGIGIEPGSIARMFDLFAQGDRSLERSEGGLGIGLTLVRSLIELHGGTVSASSDGPGLGSEFVVRLPATAAQDVASTDSRPAVAGHPEPARKARLLVVDDNVDTARGLSQLMELAGHEVRAVHDGPGAIIAARELRPDLVFLDIGLPGMDGYQVARKLRTEDACADCVIVAVSGYGQDSDRRRSLEAGMNYHMTKPVDFDALMDVLARHRFATLGPDVA